MIDQILNYCERYYGSVKSTYENLSMPTDTERKVFNAEMDILNNVCEKCREIINDEKRKALTINEGKSKEQILNDGAEQYKALMCAHIQYAIEKLKAVLLKKFCVGNKYKDFNTTTAYLPEIISDINAFAADWEYKQNDR